MQAFTRNYEDNSTEAGYQFTFYCDLCRDGFRSSFIESSTHKKGTLLRGVTRGAGALGSLLGGNMSHIGHGLERGGDVLSERFTGMSPEWQKEHEAAFQRAQNEAMQHFHRCHNCRSYVCDACFNDQVNLCSNCAPRENIEVAAARADRMKKQIWDQASDADVFKGEIEERTVVCPSCGRPCGSGKFCANCGASLAMGFCTNCGSKMESGARFCSECGNRQ